ncbi:hypothetical protein COO59_11450 [Mixta theicola]|uniref:Bacteriocin n=1 Tax=Mixta theicola TaxID=1458355 RepID=A0A2K1Q9D2_9GAMM|nr:bacteriocin [Mixta theicola]PNS11624.1 hypothetical protein COO59_11450 [Mixta theicola]GLR08718.1 hypothetical protein GCM10007905_14370 [Mixta theicola]
MKVLNNNELAQVSGGILTINGGSVFSWLEQLMHKLQGIQPLSQLVVENPQGPAENLLDMVDHLFSVDPLQK